MAGPEPKTQEAFFQEMAQAAWQRGQAALQDGDAAEALRWLARAHRIAPDDAAVALGLAGAHLRQGNPRAAVPLLSQVVATHDVREAWLALALARHGSGDAAGAGTALAAFFSGGSIAPADCTPLPAPREAAGRFAAGAVLVAAAGSGDIAAAHEACLEAGHALASHGLEGPDA